MCLDCWIIHKWQINNLELKGQPRRELTTYWTVKYCFLLVLYWASHFSSFRVMYTTRRSILLTCWDQTAPSLLFKASVSRTKKR